MQYCGSSEEGDRSGPKELGQGRRTREGLLLLWSPFLDLDEVKGGRVVGLTPEVIRNRTNKGPLSYLCHLLPSSFKEEWAEAGKKSRFNGKMFWDSNPYPSVDFFTS